MKWITLTTVDDIYHAQTLGHALEEEGILYMETNENTATLLPYLRQGIQIRVKDTDYPEARVVCDRVEAMRRLRCPNCQSSEIVYQGADERPPRKGDVIEKLVKFPVAGHFLIYRCSDCGETFKVDER